MGSLTPQKSLMSASQNHDRLIDSTNPLYHRGLSEGLPALVHKSLIPYAGPKPTVYQDFI